MVNLDELEAKWAEHDRKLDANLRLSRLLLSATTLKRARSALQRLIAFVAIESLATMASAIALGNFIYENLGAARFVLPAIALDVMAIAMLASLIRQIMTATQIDYGQPIATIQKQLEVLRMMRIRYVQRTLLAGMIGWVLLLIVATKGFLGLDVYQLVSGAWLVGNLLFGVGVIVAVLWLSRKYSDRMGRYPVLQWLMKTFAAYNLNAAADFLATLSEFEKEER